MADPIAAFCAAYHDYHAISPARRALQVRALREFEASVAPRSLLEATADDLRALANAQVAAGLHPNTVRKHLNAIRPFLTWAWERKLIDGERLLEFRAVRPPRGSSRQGTPRPYKRAEVERFWRELDAAYPWARDGDAERGRFWLNRWQRGLSRWPRVQSYAKRTQMDAIAHLALHGALRRDEIFNLDVEEMHHENAYLVVRSARKNPDGEARVRAVPWMTPAMRTSVENWLRLRDVLAPDHDRPWLSLHQHHYLKPMRHRQFEMLMRNIGRGWEFHRMRHTAATEMLRSGMPLDKVSVILGHTQLEQTRVYTKVLPDDVVRAAAKIEDEYATALRKAA